MTQHFIEVSELKTDKCFLEWRMTDNCLIVRTLLLLLNRKTESGKYYVRHENRQ